VGYSAEHRLAFRLAVGEEVAPRELDGIRWNRWLKIVARERLACMMRVLDRDRLPPAVAGRLGAFERAVLARQVFFDHHAERLFRGLDRAGVSPIPLKGYVLAREIYRGPGVRDMADIDLLVRPQEVPAAARALSSMGWRAPPDADPSRVPERGATLNAMLFNLDGGPAELRCPVHLHWDVYNATLPVALALPPLPLEEVRRAARPAPNGARLPDLVHLAVMVAEHALKHSFHELVSLVDLARLLTVVDRAAVARTAARWGLEFPLAASLALIAALRGLPASERVCRVRGLDGRWFLRSILSNRRWNGLSAVAYLSLMCGLRGRARLLGRMFFPPRDELRRRGRSPGLAETWRRCALALAMVTSAD
jgi:hypothetical protein